jgi:hypothetical protein
MIYRIVFTWIVFFVTGVFFTSCYEPNSSGYPHGAVVGLCIEGVAPDYPIALEFNSWVLNRLKVFATEKKDFTVDTTRILGTKEIPKGVTHVITISIDSLNLISFKKYKQDYAAVDSVVSRVDMVFDKINKVDQIVNLSDWSGSYSNNIPVYIFHAALDRLPRPTLFFTISVRDVKTGATVWNYSKEIIIESVKPIPEDEQLGQMLAILKSTVEQKVTFFKMK